MNQTVGGRCLHLVAVSQSRKVFFFYALVSYRYRGITRKWDGNTTGSHVASRGQVPL